MPLTSSQLNVIRLLFDKFDKDKSGALSADEFTEFIKTALKLDLSKYAESDTLPDDLEQADLSDDVIKWLLNGIDINNDHMIAFHEVVQCFAALKEKDIMYLTKMSFRALDLKRDRIVDVKNIKNNAGIYGEQLTNEEFIAKMKEVLGKKKRSVNFAEYYRIITGGIVPMDTDPYDGEIGQSVRSTLCILL